MNFCIKSKYILLCDYFLFVGRDRVVPVDVSKVLDVDILASFLTVVVPVLEHALLIDAFQPDVLWSHR